MNSGATNYIKRHEDCLREFIKATDFSAPRLKEAVSYCLFSGGKRLRPLLVYLSGTIAQAELESLDIIAAAIELIHCYSLIHDDLPAMDNDDFRRGRPTCHRAYDEATAILAGDGMQSFANELLLSQLPLRLSIDKVLQITLEINKASGFSGMVGGQFLDLSELSNGKVTENQLFTIHQLKTGALFSACINMALLAGNPSEAVRTSLQQYAALLGVVFQMQDDYRDRYGDHVSLGKNRASDEANNKITFAQLYTQQRLEELIHQYYNQALGVLELLGEKAISLIELTVSLRESLP